VYEKTTSKTCCRSTSKLDKGLMWERTANLASYIHCITTIVAGQDFEDSTYYATVMRFRGWIRRFHPTYEHQAIWIWRIESSITLSVIIVSLLFHPLHSPALSLLSHTLNRHPNQYTLRAPCGFQTIIFLLFYHGYTDELLLEHSFLKPGHFHK